MALGRTSLVSQDRRMLRTTAACLLIVLGAAACSSDDFVFPAPANPTATAIGDSVFIDPQGAYELSVPASWEANHGAFVAEVELWFVAEPQDGFGPNVNILTQAAPDLSLSDYLQISIENAPLFLDDFELLDSSIIEGDDGQSLATMEYTGGGLEYLGVFTLTPDGQAIVATLTSPSNRYEEIHDEVLPYLLTLKPTDTD